MKIKTTVAALSVLSVLSFGAFAADSIDAAQAQNREPKFHVCFLLASKITISRRI